MEKTWKAPDVNMVVSGDSEAKEQLQSYLQNFGYLDAYSKNDSVEAEKKLNDALLLFQQSHKIPETGIYDDATKSAISSLKAPVRPFFTPEFRSNDYIRGPGRRWEAMHISWCLENKPKNMTYQDSKSVFQDAFNKWDARIPISFHEVSSEPDISVKFVQEEQHGDRYPIGRFDADHGHAFFPPPLEPNDSPRLAGDIHVNDNIIQSWQKASLLQTALHLIGHSLGLTDSDVLNVPCVMRYPFIGNFEDLGDLDIERVKRLYQ